MKIANKIILKAKIPSNLTLTILMMINGKKRIISRLQTQAMTKATGIKVSKTQVAANVQSPQVTSR